MVILTQIYLVRSKVVISHFLKRNYPFPRLEADTAIAISPALADPLPQLVQVVVSRQ